jgi:hypothetical protein
MEEVWQNSEHLRQLACFPPAKLLSKRKNIYLLQLAEHFQDYAASSSQLSDDEANRIGDAILRVQRVADSLYGLAGGNFGKIQSHTVQKEFSDLFAESAITFETAEFNISTASFFQRKTRIPVSFVPEEKNRRTPDLRVGTLSYVESKDLHTTNRSNIGPAIREKIREASMQLHSIQSRDPLPGSGICIDMPWGTLPLLEEEGPLIAEALIEEHLPDFLLLSASGTNFAQEGVQFPVAQSLIWKPKALHLYEPLLRKLTFRSHILHRGKFELIDRTWSKACIRNYLENPEKSS